MNRLPSAAIKPEDPMKKKIQIDAVVPNFENLWKELHAETPDISTYIEMAKSKRSNQTIGDEKKQT